MEAQQLRRSSSKKFSQKRRPAESDEFLWLISLSDLMILLFIFFVVMFSFTHDKLKQQDMEKIMAVLQNKEIPPDPIDKVKKDLDKWVEDQKLNDQIVVTKTKDGVFVEIKDQLLFGSGEFVPHIKGKAVMELLAQTLNTIPEPYSVGIEGHTDDTPIHTSKISDNWDLSSKRAWAVKQAMPLLPGILKRTILMAYGEMKPLVPNRDPYNQPLPANQSKNRRVTIRIF